MTYYNLNLDGDLPHLQVQSGPANAFVEDTYKISQKEQQEYERILKERGVKLPELTLPKV